jgi:AAA+ ATPase superfamily predicted ATPase
MLFFFSAPRIFQELLNILKPFQTPHTAKGLRLYGLNREEWKRELLKIFPEDQLIPEFVGVAGDLKS